MGPNLVNLRRGSRKKGGNAHFFAASNKDTFFQADAMNILLHICCGPCAIFPLEQLLEEGHTVSGFFYNPNIHPLTEYMKRREGALQVAEHFGIPLIFCDEPLGATVFFRAVNGSEEQGTSGRCGICQTMRLVRTAAEAAARHCDAFTSSLLYSRYQDHNHLKEQGAAAAAAHPETAFLYRDFRGGWRRGVDRSKELGIYRQQYCGCVYSIEDRYAKDFERMKNAFPGA